MQSKFDISAIQVVLYHGSCADGFGSAFIVWHYYKTLNLSNDIIYIPCRYLKDGDNVPENILTACQNKNVLMVDFSYKYPQLLILMQLAKSFLILDHHLTAKADLANIDDDKKIFDLNKSGVGITWEVFHPQKSLPRFLALIQDRDLWRYSLPYTLEFVTVLYTQPQDFILWESYLDDGKVDQTIAHGRAWLEYQNIITDRLVDSATYILQEWEGQYIIVVYVNSPEFKSDVGNKLFDKYPLADFSVVWNYDLYKNNTYFSLRSTDDRLDVSAVAKKLGGGGHRNASGLTLPGLAGCLPLPRIADGGLLSALRKKVDGTLVSGEEGKAYSYTLLTGQSPALEWKEEKFIHLIRRKTSGSDRVIFKDLSPQPQNHILINYIPIM